MKTKRLLLALLCLLLLAETGQTTGQDDLFRQWEHPLMQQIVKKQHETAIRSFWDGRGPGIIIMGFLDDPDVRTALDFSDEQYQRFVTDRSTPLHDRPEFQTFLMEEAEIQQRISEYAQAGNMQAIEDLMSDAAIQEKMLALTERVTSLAMELVFADLDNNLTPEQKRKIGEAHLAFMSEVPIISPNIFEALHLTDAQKRQMEAVKEELAPDFEAVLENFVNGQIALMSKEYAELERQGSILPGLGHRPQAIARQLMAEDPEYKRIYDDTLSCSMTFSTQFRTRMFDVLTDEQWQRLQNLIDNPPPHARIFIQRVREQRGETEESKSDVWMPGPGSWRPGDPLPESYRQQRNTRGRFPQPQ